MYEYAITLRLVPGSQDTVLDLLRRRVFPRLKDQPGLVSLGLVPHPESDQITILSMWKNSAYAAAAETDPEYHQHLLKLGPFLEQGITQPPKNIN